MIITVTSLLPWKFTPLGDAQPGPQVARGARGSLPRARGPSLQGAAHGFDFIVRLAGGTRGTGPWARGTRGARWRMTGQPRSPLGEWKRALRESQILGIFSEVKTAAMTLWWI